MATSWPYVSQATTDQEFSLWARELQDNGVVGALGDNSCRVTADSSGMNVKVNAGSALLQGFMYREVAQQTMTIDPAGGSARADRIVLRLNPTAAIISDRISLAYKKGSGTTPPALTQSEWGTWEEPLARVNVPVNAVNIGAVDVVDERRYIGSRIGQWDTNRRPTNPRKYKMGFNETIGNWEFWNGSTWTPVQPRVDWGSIQNTPATYSPSFHGHDLAGTSILGTLPIARGGTAGTTAKAARTNLEIDDIIEVFGRGAPLDGQWVASTRFRIQAGSINGLTDASGYARITFPKPFPAGLLTVLVMNGDDSAANDTTYAIAGAPWGTGSKTDVVYRLWGPPGGPTRTPLARHNHRTNYIAIGW